MKKGSRDRGIEASRHRAEKAGRVKEVRGGAGVGELGVCFSGGNLVATLRGYDYSKNESLRDLYGVF